MAYVAIKQRRMKGTTVEKPFVYGTVAMPIHAGPFAEGEATHK
jgi:hypothetical protein